MPTADDLGAGGAESEIDVRTCQGGDRGESECQRDWAANTDRERPDLQREPGDAQADRGRERERVEGRHLAEPHRAEPVALRLERDLEHLLIGAVQPVGRNDLELARCETRLRSQLLCLVGSRAARAR